MFCPAIGKRCVGKECRDWDDEAKDCVIRLERKRQYSAIQEVVEQQRELVAIQQSFVESDRFTKLWSKLAINRLLSDPMVAQSDKQIIEQALQAPSSEAAEKLLKDAGLID